MRELLRLDDNDPRPDKMRPDPWAAPNPGAVLTYRLAESRRSEQSPMSRTSLEQAHLIDDRSPYLARTLTTAPTRGRLDPNRGRCATLVAHPDVPRARLVDRRDVPGDPRDVPP